MSTPSKRFRAMIALLTLLTALGGSYVFARSLWAESPIILLIPSLFLFIVLFTWISFSFWLATAGFLSCLLRPRSPAASPDHAQPAAPASGLRAAILIPVYNEDPWSVFARVAAMHKSLQAAQGGDRFDFFVLSDTNRPRIWLEEELAWAFTTEHCRNGGRIHYRRRDKNVARKSGNVADFCERWGGEYRYMIVLDADSVIAAETMIEMVRRMEAEVDIGILQVPPSPVNRVSLFARLLAFASSAYGPAFARGFSWWSHVDGNYWGHNAIIRVAPFIEHCGLPTLPGKAPLGGEILSHDFVEAALMRRAGWTVRIADDLQGSYEESPVTLIDYAQRDQRWCQGNMQHLHVIFACRLHALNRMHMAMGIMSYLSSLLWMLLLVLGFASVVVARSTGSLDAAQDETRLYLALFLVTMGMLLAPKLYGYLLLLRSPDRLRSHGGAWRAAISILVETFVSAFLAPILMAFHATFVLATLAGRKVEWNAQNREEGVTTFRDAFAAHAAHTIAGLAATILVAFLAPGLLPWLSPILIGLILSVPISLLLGSVRIGRWLQERRILAIAEETEPPPVLRLQREYAARFRRLGEIRCRVDPFLQVIVDPAFAELHLAILKAGSHVDQDVDMNELRRLERVIVYGGPDRVDRAEQLAILGNERSLRWLHEAAWKFWSLETLNRIAGPVLAAS